MTETFQPLEAVPEASRRYPDDPHGHLEELRTDPIGLLQRVRDECGVSDVFASLIETSCLSAAPK